MKVETLRKTDIEQLMRLYQQCFQNIEMTNLTSLKNYFNQRQVFLGVKNDVGTLLGSTRIDLSRRNVMEVWDCCLLRMTNATLILDLLLEAAAEKSRECKRELIRFIHHSE